MDAEILSVAKDDSQDSAHALSRELFSPNVWAFSPNVHALWELFVSCGVSIYTRSRRKCPY